MTKSARRHHGHGPERALEIERARQFVAIARRGAQPTPADVRGLLIAAAEPSGPTRKVALDVLGAICRGDVAVADRLARRSLALSDEPWIGRHVAKALGRMGVASDVVLSALRASSRGHGRLPMGKRAARDALAALGRTDLASGEFPWVRSVRDHQRLSPTIERLSREVGRCDSAEGAAARLTGGLPVDAGQDGVLVVMRDASVLRIDRQTGVVGAASHRLRRLALMRAGERHVELLTLWPSQPRGSAACAVCVGAGMTRDADPCQACSGTGWGIGDS